MTVSEKQIIANRQNAIADPQTNERKGPHRQTDMAGAYGFLPKAY